MEFADSSVAGGSCGASFSSNIPVFSIGQRGSSAECSQVVRFSSFVFSMHSNKPRQIRVKSLEIGARIRKRLRASDLAALLGC